MGRTSLELAQIAVAQWGNTYSIIGLTKGGAVYRLQKEGWVPLTMYVALPDVPGPGAPDSKEPF